MPLVVREDEMSDKSEFERIVIRDILEKDRLEGLPMIWLKSKLEQILDGVDPRTVLCDRVVKFKKPKR